MKMRVVMLDEGHSLINLNLRHQNELDSHSHTNLLPQIYYYYNHDYPNSPTQEQQSVAVH